MLDSKNKVPLYFQLVNNLLDQIDTDMGPNEKLPTEKEICELYSVSRTTVRLAMSELEKRGYIYRIQGKGSFVSAMKKSSLNSFLDMDFNKHYEGINPEELTRKLISFSKEDAPLTVKQQMGIPNDQKVIRVKMIHKLSGEPVAIETIILKNQSFALLSEKEIVSEDLDTLFKKRRIFLKTIEESYQVKKISEKEKEFLDSDDECLLLATKSAFNTNNELIAILERKILTSRFHYQNILSID